MKWLHWTWDWKFYSQRAQTIVDKIITQFQIFILLQLVHATHRNSCGMLLKEVRIACIMMIIWVTSTTTRLLKKLEQNSHCEDKQNVIFIRFFVPFLGLLRTIAMNLNLGICREEEKQAKKHALIDYLIRHLKVFIKLCIILSLNFNFKFSAINCMPSAIGFVNFSVSSTSLCNCFSWTNSLMVNSVTMDGSNDF